ncbi:hypothetical protein ACFQ60_19530 [Streptomyces zhihengii]|uniref:DUF2637 domain-containing protein n=1 Tax=Streptomyces zhihengii TaxID=1818004 RepID=A0ABS2UVD4_9ACTN|nr:hypothetical protein [Streptomyces zhihengii]MBM9621526.1 hypothetical protein [Streptomyces zhihengii]
MNTDVTSELRSIRNTRKTVNAAVWVITGGAILFSLMTGAPLVSEHSEWQWTGWVLPALVDAALVLSLSADAVLSKHGLKGGRWPTAFRWVTGLASLFLNTWGSYAVDDWVGVGIHSIAPVILICTSEVAPIYRRKFRDLELTLTQEVTVTVVTQALTPKGSNGNAVTPNASNADSNGNGNGVTNGGKRSNANAEKNKAAIRKAFLAGLNPTEAAKEIGVSRSYVSQRYAEIRQELEKAA